MSLSDKACSSASCTLSINRVFSPGVEWRDIQHQDRGRRSRADPIRLVQIEGIRLRRVQIVLDACYYGRGFWDFIGLSVPILSSCFDANDTDDDHHDNDRNDNWCSDDDPYGGYGDHFGNEYGCQKA